METYCITLNNSNLIKIGRTVNLETRVRQIKTGNPFVKDVYYLSGDYENYIHRCLIDSRIKGEWFDVGDVSVIDLLDMLIHIRKNSEDDCDAVLKFKTLIDHGKEIDF